MTCRWAAHPAWCLELWSRYQLLHKRGGTALIEGTPDMLDAAEAELHAEAHKARQERERAETRDWLKAQGIIK